MAASGHAADRRDLLRIVRQEIYKCIRCGECRTVCPVFREIPAERYTARGKLVIAEALAKNELELTGGVREAIENCLLCSGCASRCSSGVRADRVIMATRQVFASELGLPLPRKAISTALTLSPKHMAIQTRVGRILQPLLCKDNAEDSGMYRRFALPFIDEKQYIPEIASVPFTARKVKQTGHLSSRVIFFTGCSVNYAMPEIGHSLVNVLNALGVSVETPEKQFCCGMSMLASGDKAAVRKQARRNIEALAKTGGNVPVVVACASCGHMLKHGYADIVADDPELSSLYKTLAARVVDVNEFIIRQNGLEKLKKRLRGKTEYGVTYHDPCHLRKAQGVVDEPRAILRAVAGGRFMEMDRPEACCGFGGTYGIFNSSLSKRIQSRKVTDAAQTGADCIATSCPGCMIQLRDGIRRSDTPRTQVKHILQLIAERL